MPGSAQELHFDFWQNTIKRAGCRAYFNNHQNDEQAVGDVEKKDAIAALGRSCRKPALMCFACRLLVTQGLADLPAGVIADRLGVLPASLTFHLQQLARAGLITQRRFGRQLIYSAEYGVMNELLVCPY